MKNKTAIETFNVLSQLNEEKGMPIKFEYGVVKLLARLEKVVKCIQDVSTKKIDGQEEYDTERVKLLENAASKAKDGTPILIQDGLGNSSYKIEDSAAMAQELKKLQEKHKDVLSAVTSRNVEIEELLDSEVEDFEPYMINIKYLPVKEGLSQLSVLQLKYMMPFLEGDIDDIPEHKGD